MNENLAKIQNRIEPLRQEIINHKVYSAIADVEDLKIFMQYHVAAVWDFMSLLKALQNKLTCTSVPWFPRGSAEIRYLINEIVVGEESDIDMNGNRISHFELYLDAMKQCGADTHTMETFLNVLEKTGSFETAYSQVPMPLAAKSFMDYTFEIIKADKSHVQAAVFCFGREDLIPNMFISIINDIHQNFPDSIAIFKYYLERHIEVDGDHHSHLALQMTANLCENNPVYWSEAEEATVKALQKRIDLWNGAYKEIMAKKAVLTEG